MDSDELFNLDVEVTDSTAYTSDPRFIYANWPLALSYDGEAYDFADLPMHLWRASSLMMGEAIKRSIEAETPGKQSPADMLIAAISCGTAVELLAKAFLAHISPGLIATDASSILILSGDVEYLSPSPKLRTRMGDEVLGTARSMLEAKTGKSPWTTQDQGWVFEARNSVAHLGLLRKERVDFMASGHKIITALLAHTENYDLDYWAQGAQ